MRNSNNRLVPSGNALCFHYESCSTFVRISLRPELFLHQRFEIGTIYSFTMRSDSINTSNTAIHRSTRTPSNAKKLNIAILVEHNNPKWLLIKIKSGVSAFYNMIWSYIMCALKYFFCQKNTGKEHTQNPDISGCVHAIIFMMVICHTNVLHGCTWFMWILVVKNIRVEPTWVWVRLYCTCAYPCCCIYV